MNSSKSEHTRFLDKTNFVKFALAAILPFQFWYVLIGLFNTVDTAWKTDGWLAMGIMAYVLLYGVVEGAVTITIFSLLAAILPKTWTLEKKRIGLILALMVLVGWTVVPQISWFKDNFPYTALAQLPLSPLALRQLLFGFTILLVGLSAAIPLILLEKYPGWLNWMEALMGRLEILSYLYLALDGIALVILIVRNITPP